MNTGVNYNGSKDGTNDLLVSNVLRTHEMQVWFLSEHLVNAPLTVATR